MAVAFITGAVIGGLIGAALIYAYNIKELRRFETRLDILEESYNNTTKRYIQAVYLRLVQLRAEGIDGLDDLIGSLGRVLDDHKEDSE